MLSQGFVLFVGSSDEVPIVILRDIGASQSLHGISKCLAFWLSVGHWNVSPITRSRTLCTEHATTRNVLEV